MATIGWLTRENEIISQIEVGRTASLDPNTTSQVIRTLEAKKLIKRNQKLDERSKNPMLTEKGLEILAQALPAVEKEDISFFSLLNAQEQKTLIKIFNKLDNHETQ